MCKNKMCAKYDKLKILEKCLPNLYSRKTENMQILYAKFLRKNCAICVLQGFPKGRNSMTGRYSKYRFS